MIWLAFLGTLACGCRQDSPAMLPTPEGEAPRPDLTRVDLPEGITPRTVELGRQVYMGTAGNGICFTCHGLDGKGGPLAPDQTDGRWLHGDGSYEAILRTVKSGVPHPKEAAVPMPPLGGINHTEEHTRAVSAYVYALAQSMR